MMHLVSVIIPTYNSANTITKAINSVLSQSYKDIEIIVVDDGSTDGTFERLEPYKGRIQYIYQENRERSAARNVGFTHSHGEYIAFLDADDYWLPHKLEKQMDVLYANTHVGMVYSLAYIVDSNGKRLGITGSVDEKAQTLKEMYCKLIQGNIIPSPTPFIRRECCEKIGGFDETIKQGEDWDYWLRLAHYYPIMGIDEPLACYRVTDPECLFPKMATRNAQQAHVYVAEKARTEGWCDDSVHKLACALAWFDGALVDWGLGDFENGQRRLLRAQEYEPDLFSNYDELLLTHVINLATQLCQGKTSVGSAKDFIDNLPAMLSHDRNFGDWVQKAMYMLYRARYFQGSQVGDLKLMAKSLMRLISMEPLSILDRGIWSVAFRNFKESIRYRVHGNSRT